MTAVESSLVNHQRAKASARARAWALANPDRIKSAKARYRASEKGKSRERAFALSNALKRRMACKKWRDNNKVAVRLATQKHQSENPSLWAMYAASRKANKLALMHPSHDPIHEVFLRNRAITLSILTGEAHCVDHIIPLAAGGFHHHDNLQVLPSDLNSAKNANPFWEHEEYMCWKDVPAHLWPENLTTQYQHRLAA